MMKRRLSVAMPLSICLTAIWATHDSIGADEELIELKGTAVFSDGAPLSKATLEVVPIDEAGKPEDNGKTLYGSTDEHGRFAIQSSNRNYSQRLKVVATKWVDGDRRRWRCEIQGDTAAAGQLRLVFENRGRIVVRLFGLVDLPEDYNVSLHFVTTGSEDQVNLHRDMDSNENGIVIEGLEPRDYDVTAYVTRIRDQPWKARARIPSEPPFRALANIQFPPFEFGTLKAKVTLPDGSPAGNIALWIEASNGEAGGKRFYTNIDGKLVANKLPVGKVRIRSLDREEIARTSFHASITANETTDYGELRLKSEAEVFSWLTGTLNYVDGTPVPKVVCDGMQGDPPFDRIDWTMVGDLGVKSRFESDGSFRIRYPAGRHRLKLEIEGTNMRFMGGGGHFQSGPRINKCLLVDVDSKPGETIRRDLVINHDPQQSPQVCNVYVDWVNVFEHSVLLLVPHTDGVEWASQQVSMEQPGVHEFDYTPAGRCVILCRSPYGPKFSSRLLGEDRTIRFSEDELGSIRFTLPESVEQIPFTYQLSLSIQDFEHAVHMGKCNPAEWNSENLSNNVPLKRHADGRWLIDGLGPGAYSLNITSGDQTFENVAKLTSGGTVDIKFTQ